MLMMTEGTTNPTPAPGAQPAPSTQPAPQPAPAPNPQPSPSPQSTPGGQVFTEDYVQTLRGEAAGYRTRLRTFEQAVRQALGLAEGATLPDDVAKALAGLKTAGQQGLEQTTGRAKTALLKGAFAAAAAGKAVDVDDAFALAGQELADVEVDLETATIKVKPAQDGKQRSMADLVDAVLARKPHLRAQGAPGGVGGTAPAGGGGGQEKDEDVAKRLAEARKGPAERKSFWDRGRQ
ncbi:MAG: hypothetical protein RDU89_06980 [bacterium]|nr:hypothetical protein [bacterium]